MSNTDSGWRKRQIALDKKAENAGKLGLDYEPDKELWEKSQVWESSDDGRGGLKLLESVEKFAELVRADEREACARIVEVEAMQYAEPVWAFEIVNDIRARGDSK